MIAFPNCKINLGLHITRKREDGFHEVESVFYPLPVRDVLEVISGVQETGYGMRDAGYGIRLIQTGLTIEGSPENNLCAKAYRLLQQHIPEISPVSLYLHKVIPMGAGLGGGSSDAAFTLQLLNEKYQLKLSTQQLQQYALQLGSDCPFFIINKPCFATGRGELLQPLELDLSVYSILLIYPGIHIPTAWAFSQITPSTPTQSIRAIIQQPVETWKDQLVNHFEEPVCAKHAELTTVKQALYQSGALYASMTGSGSAFYGIYRKNQLPVTNWPPSYTVFSIK